MNSQKIVEYDQNWQEKYQDMIASPQKAVTHIRPGQRVFIGTGCAEPVELENREVSLLKPFNLCVALTLVICGSLTAIGQDDPLDNLYNPNAKSGSSTTTPSDSGKKETQGRVNQT